MPTSSSMLGISGNLSIAYSTQMKKGGSNIIENSEVKNTYQAEIQ